MNTKKVIFFIKTRKFVNKFVLAAIALAVLLSLLFLLEIIQTDYETFRVEDYGKYVGVLEEYKSKYITSFFPEEIHADFCEVKYVFHSRNVDTCGFEAYLEFTIPDQAAFDNYVSRATKGMRAQKFYFDESFQEYSLISDDQRILYDTLILNTNDFWEETGEVFYYIESAYIAKILVNPKEHRVIYLSLVVSDGGGTDTRLLGTFFNRFNIDPRAYEKYTETIA